MSKKIKKQMWLTEDEVKMIQIIRAYNLSPSEILSKVGLVFSPKKTASG